VDVTTSRADGDVRINIGSGPKTPGPLRGITLQDPLPVALADAIVRGLGGTVEQRIGNPGSTFAILLRATGTR
jgi:hypothetical protein